MGRYLHPVSKLLKLPAADKWLVFKVAIMLPLVEGGLQLFGLQVVSRILSSRAKSAVVPFESSPGLSAKRVSCRWFATGTRSPANA
jgi:hypothetical protein